MRTCVRRREGSEFNVVFDTMCALPNRLCSRLFAQKFASFGKNRGMKILQYPTLSIVCGEKTILKMALVPSFFPPIFTFRSVKRERGRKRKRCEHIWTGLLGYIERNKYFTPAFHRMRENLFLMFAESLADGWPPKLSQSC